MKREKKTKAALAAEDPDGDGAYDEGFRSAGGIRTVRRAGRARLGSQLLRHP